MINIVNVNAKKIICHFPNLLLPYLKTVCDHVTTAGDGMTTLLNLLVTQ